MSLLLKKFNKGQLEFLQNDEPKCNLHSKKIEASYLDTAIPQQLTLPEVSRILCISIGTARNIISAGGDFPPNYRAGRKRLFCPIELKKWLCKKQLEN
jgi:hypothetical protein